MPREFESNQSTGGRRAEPFVRWLITVFGVSFSCCLVSGCGFLGLGGSDQPLYYTVEKGDTLWEISREHDIPIGELLARNGIANPRELAIGQRLLIHFGSSENRNLYSSPSVIPVKTTTRAPATEIRDLKGKGLLSWPLKSGRLVSRFGPRKGSFHDGIDIANRDGTPVYAAHSGIIQYAGSELGGYGKLILLKGDDRLVTVYAHNRQLKVSTGQRVIRGEQIAEVGSTGRSSGPHLHFEVRMKDRSGRLVALDPLPILNSTKNPAPRYRVNESLSAILAKLIS